MTVNLAKPPNKRCWPASVLMRTSREPSSEACHKKKKLLLQPAAAGKYPCFSWLPDFARQQRQQLLLARSMLRGQMARSTKMISFLINVVARFCCGPMTCPAEVERSSSDEAAAAAADREAHSGRGSSEHTMHRRATSSDTSRMTLADGKHLETMLCRPAFKPSAN